MRSHVLATLNLGVKNEFSAVAFFKSIAAPEFRSAGRCFGLIMMVVVPERNRPIQDELAGRVVFIERERGAHDLFLPRLLILG